MPAASATIATRPVAPQYTMFRFIFPPRSALVRVGPMPTRAHSPIPWVGDVALTGLDSAASKHIALDQWRENWSYLELKIPFRTIELWPDRVVLRLHVELYRQWSEFAQLSNLQAHWKCHLVTAEIGRAHV